MGGKSKIEWCDKVWNPITGCSKVSQGCKHCYAERFASRQMGQWKGRAFTEVRCHPERLEEPLKWKKPQRIFVNSMSDLFHEEISVNFLLDVWDIFAQCPQHTFLVLTKRPRRMRDFLRGLVWYQAGEHDRAAFATPKTWPAAQVGGARRLPPLLNVWPGVSVEDQKAAGERIPLLLETPAAVRWISAEPLLGRIDLDETPALDLTVDRTTGKIPKPLLDWVVCGGESGPGARPMHPNWAGLLRYQCESAKVPFFFKQWGEWIPVFGQRHGLKIHQHFEFPDGLVVGRVGKKAAGRLLDGREWNQYPETEMAVTA